MEKQSDKETSITCTYPAFIEERMREHKQWQRRKIAADWAMIRAALLKELGVNGGSQ